MSRPKKVKFMYSLHCLKEAHTLEKAFPEEMKFIRTVVGISQSELAITLGVSQPCIQRWENGLRKPSVYLWLLVHLEAEWLKEKAREEKK